MRQEEQGAEAPYLEPKARDHSLFKRRKEERQYTANLNSYMYTGKDSVRLLQAYEVWILSKDITHCKATQPVSDVERVSKGTLHELKAYLKNQMNDSTTVGPRR